MTRLLPYYGSKYKLAPWIIGLMPAHRVYLEPFAGSLSVLLAKEPASVETANDLDGDVVNFFRVLRDHPEELARAIELTPYAREEYELSFDPADDPLERARRFAVKLWFSMSGRVIGKASGFSRGCKGTSSNKALLWSRVPETIEAAALRLKGVQIECRDALQLIQEYDGPDVLIYCDPPYIGDLRTNSKQYQHDMDVEDHQRLVETLKASSAMIMLSGYRNDLYDAELSEWHTECIATSSERGAKKTEVLWLNPAARDRMPQLMIGVEL